MTSSQLGTPYAWSSVPFTAKNWTNLAAYVITVGSTYASVTAVFGEPHRQAVDNYHTLLQPVSWCESIGYIFFAHKDSPSSRVYHWSRTYSSRRPL